MSVRLDREGEVAWIWLERPEVHNAFNADVISKLTTFIDEVRDSDARVLVLASQGRTFSAGADLNWMRSAGDLSEAENVADATKLAAMLRRLDTAPQATVARVQGAALGGGLGLIAACDIAIAAARARFGFSEVNLGLIPAVISPHVIAKIGPGHARHLFVSGARFTAATAERIGLIAKVVDDGEALDVAIGETLEQLHSSSPGAVRAAKELVRQVTSLPADQVDPYTAHQIARQRVSADGKEGIAAFLEKRPPRWATPAS